MKIEKSNQIINPFGGINFVFQAIKQSGVLDVIDNQSGDRASQAVHSYSDLLLNLWSMFFCGGDCAGVLNEHLKNFLKDTPSLDVANAYTFLGVLKSLTTYIL